VIQLNLVEVWCFLSYKIDCSRTVVVATADLNAREMLGKQAKVRYQRLKGTAA
jgi:hypothetical protein